MAKLLSVSIQHTRQCNPASEINEIVSVGKDAYVVHIHGYDRALEATEVVADKMSQYNATKSFTDQYP